MYIVHCKFDLAFNENKHLHMCEIGNIVNTVKYMSYHNIKWDLKAINLSDDIDSGDVRMVMVRFRYLKNSGYYLHILWSNFSKKCGTEYCRILLKSYQVI